MNVRKVDWKQKVKEWLDKFPDYKQMALEIQTDYKVKNICQCNDEKYAGGYWDMAMELIDNELSLDDEADIEFTQMAIYSALKDDFVNPQGYDCDGNHD